MNTNTIRTESATIPWRANLPYPRPTWMHNECVCGGWGSVPLVEGLTEMKCPKGCELREPTKPKWKRARKAEVK